MSENDKSDHPALAALKAFYRDMYAWEREMLAYDKKVDRGEVKSDEEASVLKLQLREKLKKIFRRHVDVGDRAARFKDFLYNQDPPEYDLRHERIVSVVEKNGRAMIETAQTRGDSFIRFKLKYELVQKGDRWFVKDNRKCSFDFETKWKSHPL